MKLFKYAIIPVLLLVPEFSISQELRWQLNIDQGDDYERIEDMVLTEMANLICVGYADGKPTIFKTDTFGNVSWFKNLIGDTLEGGYYSFIKAVPEEPGYFYLGAYASESLPVADNRDIFMKIDTTGDTLWSKRFFYPTFYQTLSDAAILRDKSVVTTGHILDATGFNIITRRIDSTGNILWENVYSLPEEQFGVRIVEMLDGSLVISGRHSNNKYSFLKIRFDGVYIDHSAVPSIRNSQYALQDLSLLPNNHIAMSSLSSDGFDEIGTYIELNENLDTTRYLELNNGILLGPIVLVDSSLFLHGYTFNNDYFFGVFDQNLSSVLWDTLYANLSGGDLFQANTYQFLGPDMFVGGIGGTSVDSADFRIAKIQDMGNPWIPDRCAYQPPVAGFEYEYNYPILTLRDTSSGGLKYLDTVYTWQWSTSNGFNGTDDSLMVFFDTAISKTLDVQLIISNWYGCTDTANITLNFDPNGISEEKPLDVKVYPNPVSDYFTIELEGEHEGNTFFELFDLHGKRLEVVEMNSRSYHYPMERLPGGVYILKLQSGNRQQRFRVVKL